MLKDYVYQVFVHFKENNAISLVHQFKRLLNTKTQNTLKQNVSLDLALSKHCIFR